MKNLLKNIIISILILIMSIIIYSLFVNSKPIAIAQQEKIEPPMVDTLKLSSKKHFINIKAYGEIVSDRILNIKYRENGKIIKIGNNIKNGEYLKKGDLIFKIDSFYIENEIKEKEYNELDEGSKSEYDGLKDMFEMLLGIDLKKIAVI